jgi:hypothetical protein
MSTNQSHSHRLIGLEITRLQDDRLRFLLRYSVSRHSSYCQHSPSNGPKISLEAVIVQCVETKCCANLFCSEKLGVALKILLCVHAFAAVHRKSLLLHLTSQHAKKHKSNRTRHRVNKKSR